MSLYCLFNVPLQRNQLLILFDRVYSHLHLSSSLALVQPLPKHLKLLLGREEIWQMILESPLLYLILMMMVVVAACVPNACQVGGIQRWVLTLHVEMLGWRGPLQVIL